jgi:hypothetical protein
MAAQSFSGRAWLGQDARDVAGTVQHPQDARRSGIGDTDHDVWKSGQQQKAKALRRKVRALSAV